MALAVIETLYLVFISLRKFPGRLRQVEKIHGYSVRLRLGYSLNLWIV